MDLLETLQLGDIFLTRNASGDSPENPSPGFYNHTAILGGVNIVIEAQFDKGVIECDLQEFLDRYPVLVILRYRDGLFNNKAAKFAKTLLNKKYTKIASLFRYLRKNKGENCVSVVRKSFYKASGVDPKWKFPDHIYKDPNTTEIYRK